MAPKHLKSTLKTPRFYIKTFSYYVGHERRAWDEVYLRIDARAATPHEPHANTDDALKHATAEWLQHGCESSRARAHCRSSAAQAAALHARTMRT